MKSDFRKKLKIRINDVLNNAFQHPLNLGTIWGFVIGAIMPTYALMLQGTIQLGDVGTWVAAIATFSAVWVSLYLANKSNSSDLKWVKNSNPFSNECELVNYGQNSTDVKIYITVEDLQKYNNVEVPAIKWFNAVDTMGKEFEKSVKDSKGNVIKSSDRLRINSNGRLVFFIEPTKAMNDSVKFLCGGKTEHNMYSVLVHVEDATGLLQERGIILSYH